MEPTPLLMEACRRQLAISDRFRKRTTGFLRVEGGDLRPQALSVCHAPIQAPLEAWVENLIR